MGEPMRVLVFDPELVVRSFFVRELSHRVEVREGIRVDDALLELRSSRLDVLVTSERVGEDDARLVLAKCRKVQSGCRRALLYDGAAPPPWSEHADRCFSMRSALVLSVEWILAVRAGLE